MNIFRIPTFLFCIMILPNLVWGLEIRLKDFAVVEGDMVSLGEVADLYPASDASRSLAMQTLFRAPAPGGRSSFKADEIKSYLSRKSDAAEKAQWTGAKTVRVERAGIEIGERKIRDILDEFIEQKRSFLPQAQIRFKTINFPPPFVLPKGNLSYEVIPSDPQILDSRRFALIFKVDGQAVKNIAVPVRLEAIAPVAVAAIDLQRGAVLGPEDMNMAPLDLVETRNPCLSLDELLGKRIKRSVRVGQPIDRRNVEFPPLVKRGEVVTISLRKKGLLISAKGTARRDGVEGSLIKVRNNSSGKDILCKVVAPGRVEVEF